MSEKATVVLKDARATPAAPSGQPIELPRIDDYYKWSIEQAAYIRAGRFDLVDLLNVADEIESVGKSEARELRSNLEIVLIHLLKWDQQPQRRGRSWALSIAEHRARVLETLQENPSLKVEWDQNLNRAYHTARLRAARETKLALKRFPEICPFDRETIMTAPYDFDEH